jgi:hypothetical protein
VIYSLIFALSQLGPVLYDNQWRVGDKYYSWPLSSNEWSVEYYHGNELLNGPPPVDRPLQWECLLNEVTRKATCVSTWDIQAGTACRTDREYVPFEHPAVWYESYRGVGPTSLVSRLPQPSRAFFWSYQQRLPQFPQFNFTPRYAWDYHRIQWIPSGPNCNPRQGCAARARYFIQETSGGLSVMDHPTQSSGTWPLNVPALSSVGEHGRCRGWVFNTNWCEINPNRSECNAASSIPLEIHKKTKE